MEVDLPNFRDLRLTVGCHEGVAKQFRFFAIGTKLIFPIFQFAEKFGLPVTAPQRDLLIT